MPRSPALSPVVASAPDLERDAGDVLVVLLGGAVWIALPPPRAAEATKGTRLSVPFTRQLPYTL